MGKKIPEVMTAEKDKLFKGFIEHGMTEAKAEQLWKLIEPFAAYGFNKAHAASYGRVAYQTAYMKANFPVEYMSAVLTADSGDTEKISEIIHECVRMNIEVLPPDINESFADFSVVPNKNTIRFGLTTIKNFGAGIAEIIIEERKKNGLFTSMQNFLSRIHDRNLNKKSIEALICVGAFDCFGKRSEFYGNIDNLLAYNREHVTGLETGQNSLFGELTEMSNLIMEPVETISIGQMLLWEKELLGVYVSGHPLDAVKEEVDKRPRISQVKKGYQGTTVVTTGLVETVKELLTKKGNRMAFIKITDQDDSIETVAFPETYRDNRELLTVGTCVAIKGKFNLRNDEPSILIDKVKLLSPITTVIKNEPESI
jgi:DNA polymerase-3 subunit alpha